MLRARVWALLLGLVLPTAWGRPASARLLLDGADSACNATAAAWTFDTCAAALSSYEGGGGQWGIQSAGGGGACASRVQQDIGDVAGLPEGAELARRRRP